MSNLTRPGGAPKRTYRNFEIHRVNRREDYKFVHVSYKRTNPKTLISNQLKGESRYGYAQRVFDETTTFEEVDDAVDQLCEKFEPDFAKLKDSSSFRDEIKKNGGEMRWHICKWFNIKKGCRSSMAQHFPMHSKDGPIMNHICLICYYLMNEKLAHPSRECSSLKTMDEFLNYEPSVEVEHQEISPNSSPKPGPSKPKKSKKSKKSKKTKKDNEKKERKINFEIDQAAEEKVRQVVADCLKKESLTRNKRTKSYRQESSSGSSSEGSKSRSRSSSESNQSNEKNESDNNN